MKASLIQRLPKIQIALFMLVVFVASTGKAQKIDSVAKALVDTIKNKLIVDDIPRKTFTDKLFYAHRWYVKQLLDSKVNYFDTNYIISNKRKLTLATTVAKKFFGFSIDDRAKSKVLQFSPNNYYYVGFNFSNIILTFGFSPGIKFGAKPNEGVTKCVDKQITFIGRRVITDINIQNYQGFYIHNANEYGVNTQLSNALAIRPDIKVLSLGVNTMYVFNNRKYSLRGAFSFTDIQKKSAGSFMAGLYHSHINFSSTDSTLVKAPFSGYFSPVLSQINKISVGTLGASLGYGYTFVYKKIIFSTVLNVGVGGQKISYETTDNNLRDLAFNPALHINAKAALRYDNQKLFFGIKTNYDVNFTFNSKLFDTENYLSDVVFFVGYRFNIKQNGRKILKAFGLIDYKKS